MKKLLAIALMLCLFLPCCASAEGVLVDGWENASLDELMDARDALAKAIAQKRVQPAQETPVTFSGSGVTITDGFTLAAGVWCRWINYSDLSYSLSPKVTESVNGKNDLIYLPRPEVEVFQLSSNTTYDYLAVEIDCDWSIEYIPLDYHGTLDLSGSTSAVSCFTCTRPTLVTVTASRHGMDRGYYGLHLLAISKDGRLREVDSTAFGNLEEGESVSVDAIINPSTDIEFFLWQMVCDAGVEWSITAK